MTLVHLTQRLPSHLLRFFSWWQLNLQVMFAPKQAAHITWPTPHLDLSSQDSTRSRVINAEVINTWSILSEVSHLTKMDGLLSSIASQYFIKPKGSCLLLHFYHCIYCSLCGIASVCFSHHHRTICKRERERTLAIQESPLDPSWKVHKLLWAETISVHRIARSLELLPAPAERAARKRLQPLLEEPSSKRGRICLWINQFSNLRCW